MALPVVIPNTFANATTTIPLSQLDNNFTTVAVSINGIANGAETLSNVQISGGNAVFTTANATTSTITNLSSSNVTITGGTVDNVTVSNLTISSGNVTVTDVNATTVDTTNIEVTNIKAKDGTAAATIADSTGKITVSTELAVDNLNLSGNAITSTDTNGNIDLTPNGTGEVNISKVDIDSGAIDGTTIGASSASTGAFTTLSASSTATFAAGAVGTPSITTAGDTNTGIFFPAADTIAFAEGGAEAMRLDSSGNLGLGVTPSAWFSLQKTLQFGGTFSGVTRAGALTSQSNDTVVQLFNNAYVNASNVETYFADGEAAKYKQNRNIHEWHTAPSGTAGNAISFSQAMTLTAAGDLGIGTSSPATKLHVNTASGGVQVRATSDTDVSFSATATGADSTAFMTVINDARQWTMRVNGAESDQFQIRDSTAGVTRVILDSAGNLGLENAPNSAWSGRALQLKDLCALSATGAGNTSSALTHGAYWDGTNWKYLTTSVGATRYQMTGANSGSTHSWSVSAGGTAGNAISFTQAMTLDASGNLMVGVASSSQKFRVSSGSDGTQIGFNGVTRGVRIDFDSTGSSIFGVDNTLVGSYQPLTVGGSITVLATGGTERARIDSSGNLLVGTTSNSRGARLRVEGIETAYFTGYGNGYGIGLWMTPNPSATGGTATPVSFQNVSDATVGSISTTASATAYNTSSDYRLKNITGPITTSGAYIDSLNPVEGTWKVDGSTFVGLIAHEVQEVSRTRVATGEKDGEEMQGIDYSSAEIIANLIAEVKSLRTRVAELEAK